MSITKLELVKYNTKSGNGPLFNIWNGILFIYVVFSLNTCKHIKHM